jgi:hypothetical protein
MSPLLLLSCAEPRTHAPTVADDEPTREDSATDPTGDTGSPQPPPSWTGVQLDAAASPAGVLSNGAVAVVDGEVWLTWERSEGGEHVQRVQRVVGGVADPPFDVGGPLAAGSFVAAIAAHPSSSAVVIQKLVDCDPGGLVGLVQCGRVPVEVELVWIDRATQVPTVEPVVHRSISGLEKGRGMVALLSGGVIACFKGKHRNRLKDEVYCSDRRLDGSFGGVQQVSGGSEGTDDHPAVALHAADGQYYVLFTSNRLGIRGTWLGVLGEVAPMHPSTVRGEDPVIVEAPDGTLHGAWVETRYGAGATTGPVDPMVVVLASCAEADCRSPDAWTVEDVEVESTGKLVAPSLAVSQGRPLLAYGAGGEVRVMIRCDDGWRMERPWDHGQPQWTKHGQPSLAADDDGTVHLVLQELDAAGNDTVWLGQRTGPLCPASR